MVGRKPSKETPVPNDVGGDGKEDSKENGVHEVMESEFTVLSAQAWDVWSPPPIDSLKGHFVPETLVKYRRRRRISVEVHRIRVAAEKNEEPRYYEECFARILLPATAEEDQASRKRGKAAIKIQKELRRKAAMLGKNVNSTLRPGESSMSVGPGAAFSVNGEIADDASVVGAELMDEDGASVYGEDGQAAWKAKYKMPLDMVVVNKVVKNKCHVTTTHMGVRHARTLIFDTDMAASDFADLIDVQKGFEKERSDAKLKAILGGLQVKSSDKVSLLIEIVSGGNLPIADISSSDPLVQVSISGIEYYRTQFISKTLDPIWTVKTGSLFLLEVTAKELFSNPKGVMFKVMDFDQFGKNETLGAAFVPAKTLYESTGERMELKLHKAPGQKENFDYHKDCFLAIRCRHSSEYDRKFMEQLTTGDKKPDHLDPTSAQAKAQETAGGKGALKSMATIHTKKVDGIAKFKVRPGPDPKQKKETEWMSKREIDEECMKDTVHWLDIGSGPVGRLYVEVLKCSGLPQLDSGVAGNVTDAFVSVIFEDGIMQTDIVDDCLSPRWLPWTKRGFIFHMLHSSSPLFLGIFDYDGGALDDHDLIGRVAVNVSNLRPETVYVQSYEIFDSATLTDRKPQGRITVRLRLEIDDERALLLSNLAPPPEIYVNVSKKKDFHVARHTISGKHDESKFNTKVLYSYIDELNAYQYLTYYLQDAVITLLLWKGQAPVTVFGKTYNVPLHSLTAFLVGIFLVERPQLVPSFFFGAIAWLLIAVGGWRQGSPNPWFRCKSFTEMVQVLVLGHGGSPDSIEAYENEEAARKFVEDFQERVREAEKEAERKKEEAAKLEEERLKELEELGELDTDISSGKKGGFTVNPYRAILWPAQQYLGIAVKIIRLIKNIVVWEECYFSFWITFGCFCLAVIFYFVPWFWIMKWSARIAVWTIFGPWMKLVDVLYYSKLKPLSEEEKEKQLSEQLEKQRELNAGYLKEARIVKENTTKMKDMKKYMFGKYITKVPVLKQERYIPPPLAESFATPYKPEPLGLADLAMKEAGYNRTRLPGQHLVGDMIPRVETKAFTDAPVGKPTARPGRLEKDSPGKVSGSDSTAAAYMRIGAVVVAAGVITWFGAPVLSSFTSYLLSFPLSLFSRAAA